jgi:hypothetical protein
MRFLTISDCMYEPENQLRSFLMASDRQNVPENRHDEVCIQDQTVHSSLTAVEVSGHS